MAPLTAISRPAATSPPRGRRVLALALGVALLGGAPSALAKASHAGWPVIDGLLKMNRRDQSRPLRGRSDRHNELLGGHGNDTIYAGNAGDVIWGDYKPSGQPSSQRDLLHGGPGNDYIYSSHGFNHIWTGAGNDHVFVVYGHGIIECGPGHKTIVMRRLKPNRHWRLHGCRRARIVPYAA